MTNHSPAVLDLRAPKVFGIGLSRTGTRTLTEALRILGFRTKHYPIDAGTLSDLKRGDGQFRLLDLYDGLTDITTIPFIHELDTNYPGAKFVLTVRSEESWLKSCRNHWEHRRPLDPGRAQDRTHLQVRLLLRAAVYGCHEFNATRFARIAREHRARVDSYFAGRPDGLLVLDIAAGEGWERLAPFVGLPAPTQPFPRKGGKLTARLAMAEGTQGETTRSPWSS